MILVSNTHKAEANSLLPEDQANHESEDAEVVNKLAFDEDGMLLKRDGFLFRRLSSAAWSTCESLEQTGLLEDLNEQFLVGTEISDRDQKEVIHEWIPFVTYLPEWTMEMFREAALCTLDLAITLNAHGFRLHDCHPWNICFINGQPRYVDFSSIKAGTDPPADWWFNEFFIHFYVPLWLASQRRGSQWNLIHHIKNELHPYFTHSGNLSGVKGLVEKLSRGRLGSWMFRRYWGMVRRYKSGGTLHQFLTDLKREVKSFQIEVPTGEWATYPEPGGNYGDVSSFSPKAIAVAELLDELPSGRLLDIACNSGWFSGLAASSGHQVLAIDLEEPAIERARSQAKLTTGLDVGLANPLTPTSSFGRGLSYPSAIDRWQVDTVLLISIVHHLVLRQNLSFRDIVDMTGLYGPKRVIVELPLPSDRYLRDWAAQGIRIPEWYNEDEFIAAWLPQFTLVQRRSSSPVPHNSNERVEFSRSLFLFEK